jgi:hypothetical protein
MTMDVSLPMDLFKTITSYYSVITPDAKPGEKQVLIEACSLNPEFPLFVQQPRKADYYEPQPESF